MLDKPFVSQQISSPMHTSHSAAAIPDTMKTNEFSSILNMQKHTYYNKANEKNEFWEFTYLHTGNSDLPTKKLDLLFLRSGSGIKFLHVKLI